MRYPYNVFLRTPDGWLASAALVYGAVALVSGMALAKEGGRYGFVSGADARILGFLFFSAALGYFAWVQWRANTSWKAKMLMRVSLISFCAVLIGYLWKAFAS